MGNSHLHVVEEVLKCVEITENCKKWAKVDCNEIPDSSVAKQCTERNENCILYGAKMLKINRRHDTCISNANEANEGAERNERVEACNNEFQDSLYKVLDLYYEKLFSHNQTK